MIEVLIPEVTVLATQTYAVSDYVPTEFHASLCHEFNNLSSSKMDTEYTSYSHVESRITNSQN